MYDEDNDKGGIISPEDISLFTDTELHTREGSDLYRLSENAKFKNFGIDTKGLMTRKTAQIPILGQPVYY